VFGSLGAAALGVPCLGEMTGLVLKELAEFFPLAGGIGAEPVQLGGGTGAQLVQFAGGVLPDAGGFGGGGFGAGLGDGGPLRGLLGFLASFLYFGQRGIPCSFTGLDGGVAFGLGGGDALLGLEAAQRQCLAGDRGAAVRGRQGSALFLSRRRRWGVGLRSLLRSLLGAVDRRDRA